ncbi:MAG TPA: L-histidine N(alpha)-methyltransferase [Rhizomicrobium sp.]|jgi:dimethylhistidine N-methyltransferase|nr:L-histidine N(alpha)-methyltransferase [Rhizomicrobium sp.]
MSLAELKPWIDARASRPADSEFALALLSGLSGQPKTAPCKYFYDREGSALFDRICELPEYYPTRTEMALLAARADEIARWIGPDALLIEYGAGALKKVGLLLDALEQPRAYVPVDISGEYLHDVTARLRAARPNLAVHPIVADFTKPFAVPPASPPARRIGFFPGSTIGNLDRREALAFLRRQAAMLKGGGMLIGVDLVKDPAILHAAYNDSAGVTEAFNKNLLVRANRELDAEFDLDGFAHYAFYNPTMQRIEMHLMSLAAQRVAVAGRRIAFAEGETVHTENSHKYTVDGFRALAGEAGFTPRAVWCDPARLFSLHWLAA